MHLRRGAGQGLIEAGEGFDGIVLLRLREGDVEGDHLGPSLRQLRHHAGVAVAGDGIFADLLQRLLIETDDHDAIVVRRAARAH